VEKGGADVIDPPYFWNNVLLLAVGTLAVRGSIIALSSRIQFSERARELLSFIPAAILPAFIAPAVFFHQGRVPEALGKERFVVLALAALVCLRTRSTLATVASGLVALYVWTAVVH
jgi:branched-subunit amino acid transport protein